MRGTGQRERERERDGWLDKGNRERGTPIQEERDGERERARVLGEGRKGGDLCGPSQGHI